MQTVVLIWLCATAVATAAGGALAETKTQYEYEINCSHFNLPGRHHYPLNICPYFLSYKVLDKFHLFLFVKTSLKNFFFEVGAVGILNSIALVLRHFAK